MYTEFEQQIGFLLHDTSRLIRKCMAARLADLNISEAHWRVLGTINRFPEIGQTQIADLLAMTKASLGSLADKLEQEQLIVRKAHPTDRRAKLLMLTEKAAPMTALIKERHAILEAEYMQGISKSKQVQIDELLRTVYLYLASPAEALPDSIEKLPFAHLVGCINRLINRHFESQLKDIGVSRPQWLVLTGIHKHEGQQQNALAKALSMEKAPLGVVVDELEQAGWVKRCPHPEDRRAKQLFLTDGCRQQLVSVKKIYENLHLDILANIKPTQRQSFIQSLNQIRSNLQHCAADTEAQV